MNNDNTEVEVSELPLCNFQHQTPTLAEYDARTVLGSWANMCALHYHLHGIGLGLGKGQRLVLRT
jgi:hypothetical protein